MNPPFSSTGGRVVRNNAVYGANHLGSALRRLQSGGRLVAILGEAMNFHHANFKWWQRIACLCNIRANLTLTGNEYAKYGTAPDVQILVIDKPARHPAGTGKSNLRTLIGEALRR